MQMKLSLQLPKIDSITESNSQSKANAPTCEENCCLSRSSLTTCLPEAIGARWSRGQPSCLEKIIGKFREIIAFQC